MLDLLYLLGAAALLAFGIPFALFGAWLLFTWCAPAAYLIRDGVLLSPDGQVVEQYDGNDPKHFPAWRPYTPESSGQSN